MRLVKVLCGAALIAACLVPGARADEWNKKTFLTFSGPVQIPGATLQAGTYMFQLGDPDNARHVVMVKSKEGDKIYGMFMTIPNERLQAPDENVIMFAESPAGTPQAVQAWFYPGDRIGEEFVYPKDQASMIAKANHREVLATYEDVNSKASENERMAAIRGSKYGHVDESGAMKGETANANAQSTTAESTTAQSPAPQTTTAQASTPAAEANKPATTTATSGAATTTAPRAPTTAPSASTSASNRPAATTAPANTVNGRDSNASAGTNAVGTTGQVPDTANTDRTARRQNRDNLPGTASSLSLIELLSGLSIAGGLTLRGLRKRTSEAR
jgi:hypothetical protein